MKPRQQRRRRQPPSREQHHGGEHRLHGGGGATNMMEEVGSAVDQEGGQTPSEAHQGQQVGPLGRRQDPHRAVRLEGSPTKCPSGWSDTEGLTDTTIKMGQAIAQLGTYADFGNLAKAMTVLCSPRLRFPRIWIPCRRSSLPRR